MIELLGATYSPWTEKARWALDARGITYAFRKYAPLIGELGLRKKLGKWRGRVSVPVLTDDAGATIDDSAAIARWADAHGAGPSLFPAGREADVERFVELSERGLAAGRGASLRRVIADDDAVRELVPRNLRKLPFSTALGRFGVRRTLRKYGGHHDDAATHTAELTRVLEELRAALAAAPATGEPRTLLGALSFADIAAAQVIAFAAPPDVGLKLGPASRRCYSDPAIAAAFPDLVAWRDALYASHRGSPASQPDAA